jgi:hypothetical protein|tara:strand:- start:66 stop:443 length:378 start_codon:yes stop_codon:yes gene_type:complete
MSTFEIEHINITVSNSETFAQSLVSLFGWKVFWQGRGMEGTSILVGSGSTYIALYTPDYILAEAVPMYKNDASINHIGVVTDNLDDARSVVLNNGFTIHTEVELPPTKRLYFFIQGVDIEVTQYI